MDSVTIAAVLLAIVSGAGGAWGSQLWAAVGALVRRPFRSQDPQARTATTSGQPTGEAELAALEHAPADERRALALAEVLVARASADVEFRAALEHWWKQVNLIRSDEGNVTNTISGGAQPGPVLHGRDFGNITFGEQQLDPQGEAHQALSTLAADYGQRVLSDPRMIGNLVTDLLPDLPRERSLLVTGAEADIAGELTQHVQEQHLDPNTAVQLVARSLVDRRSLDPAASMWVTSEYAQALGYPVQSSQAPPPPGPGGLNPPPVVGPAPPQTVTSYAPYAAPNQSANPPPADPTFIPSGGGGYGGTPAGAGGYGGAQPPPPGGYGGSGNPSPAGGGVGTPTPTPPIWGPGGGGQPPPGRSRRARRERQARKQAQREAQEAAKRQATEQAQREAGRAELAVIEQAGEQGAWWDRTLPPEAGMSPPQAAGYDHLVRRAFAELIQPGRLLFNPPDQMHLGQTERVEVRLTRTLKLDKELLEHLRGHGEPQLEEIPAAPLMAVTLKGDGFQITAYSDEEQSVSQYDITTWEFDIRALERGHQRLVICVSLRIPVPGQPSEHKSIPVREATIDVQVGAATLVGHFVVGNWQWFIGTAIAIAAVVAAVLYH